MKRNRPSVTKKGIFFCSSNFDYFFTTVMFIKQNIDEEKFNITVTAITPINERHKVFHKIKMIPITKNEPEYD